MARLFIAALIAVLLLIAASIINAQGGNQPLPNYYILALQKCNSSAPHTMHGLWPQYSQYKYPSNCGGPAFSESTVADLIPQMNQVWLSCPGSSDSNLEFWSHEWSKHGTCSGWDMHTYFSKGLEVYFAGDWKQSCDSYEWTCKVKANLQPPGSNLKPVIIGKVKN